MARRSKSMSGNPAWCHLCGLCIPTNIASTKHPLYGTVDHVLPLARGGRNILENRKPAHLVCNRVKGNRMELDRQFVIGLQGSVKTLLRKVGVIVTDKELAKARRRIGILDQPTKTERQTYAYSRDWDQLRWDDDGGAVFMET